MLPSRRSTARCPRRPKSSEPSSGARPFQVADAPAPRRSRRLAPARSSPPRAVGRLLLTSIAELPASAQARLARFLRDREARIDGPDGPQASRLSLRIVATTRPPVEPDVDEGRLRPELYRRLSAVRIDLPALARRREDIPAIARQIVREVSEARGIAARPFTQAALALLAALPWDGNVHELRGAIEGLCATHPGPRFASKTSSARCASTRVTARSGRRRAFARRAVSSSGNTSRRCSGITRAGWGRRRASSGFNGRISIERRASSASHAERRPNEAAQSLRHWRWRLRHPPRLRTRRPSSRGSRDARRPRHASAAARDPRGGLRLQRLQRRQRSEGRLHGILHAEASTCCRAELGAHPLCDVRQLRLFPRVHRRAVDQRGERGSVRIPPQSRPPLPLRLGREHERPPERRD